MSTLKDRLQSDLTDAIRARDGVRAATLRMGLAAITTEEVSGKQARVLTDDEVTAVLSREAKKRRESVEAYVAADRIDLADRERAELAVLADYLPEALSADQLTALISAAVLQAQANGLEGMKAMGAVMKTLQPAVTGRADGAEVAAAVRSALGA